MGPAVRIGPERRDTYLATLYGKALDAASTRPILGDQFAADAVARIDYDFKALRLPRGVEVTLPLRARHFDQWTRAFLVANPHSTVLHLGCGLDSRVHRVDPGPAVRWYDVDLPDVIALRERLYPHRPGYHVIGTSVLDLAWLEMIPRDTPTLVIAEGLVMYLPPADGTALFHRVVELFPSGEIAFDGYSRLMTRLVSRFAAIRAAHVDLVWGIDDPHDLEKKIPGLHLAENVEFLMMPELIERLSRSPLSTFTYKIAGLLPFYRTLIRHLRYTFPVASAVPRHVG